MNNKNAPLKVMHTIDMKHCFLLNEFKKDEEEHIPKLLSLKKTLNDKIRKTSHKQVDERLRLKDEIKETTNKIRELKQKKKQYFLNNSKHIFEYFEDKQTISSGTGNKNNRNVLNSFFKIKDISNNGDDIEIRSNNIAKYWRNVNNEITNIQDYVVPIDVCHYCYNGEFIPRDEEGIMICNNVKCGKFIHYVFDGSKPSNKEPPSEPSYTAYIRLNHFKEILSQFQAKETTQIPDKVIDDISKRIKKERIQDIRKELNYDKMREILRKLGYNKYFEHIQFINSKFGIIPPIMNEQLHETLCFLFIEIQKPWAVHCPPSRTNFFNYTYTLYQLCVLLDQTQYLPYIPLMKDREKQLDQDQIWSKVCNDLDWEYHPTV